jgi:hypothetical protein
MMVSGQLVAGVACALLAAVVLLMAGYTWLNGRDERTRRPRRSRGGG